MVKHNRILYLSCAGKSTQITVAEVALRSGVSLPLNAETVIRYRGRRSAARITQTKPGEATIEFDVKKEESKNDEDDEKDQLGLF